MKFSAALFVAAVLVACSVGLADAKPQKQDSGSGASVQVGDYVLSIAKAAAACDRVINTVCATNTAGLDSCLNYGGGGIYCTGQCVNNKPCCQKCPV
ncbi:hypothetical protein AAVH_15781 [Aphelenchoides avenae]|nr:hypothetical protein AAVH_15781 [Aphelenchus avenae]